MSETVYGRLSGFDLRKLEHAAALLSSIAQDTDRFDILLELQLFLVQRICSRERVVLRIRKLSGKLRSSLRSGRLTKTESRRVKDALADCERRIEFARRWIFLWKCFGDGAACAYQSPFNLKLLFYDKDYNVKQEAGFITGKGGFDREWKILEYGIASGVPVVLADITNMIRIGDICALAGADPCPIEVKSSNTSGARTARQQQLLDDVTNFWKNDGAAKFKGLHNVTRQVIPSGPAYQHLMNDCMRQARSEGFAVVSPEPGLHYVVMTSVDQLDQMSNLLRPSVLLRSLTADPGWLPCLPFTLTLKPDNLIPFVQGKMAVFVLVDMAYLKTLFLNQGSYATMVMDGQSAIQLCLNPDDLMQGFARISELHFARVALEFQSLVWFVQENSLKVESPLPSMTKEEFDALPKEGFCFEIPKTWALAKDFYADAQTVIDSSPALIQPPPAS